MRTRNANRHSGFSLIEVMVALIIIAIGMLGIAKMQALGLSTTGSSGTRSLVAIEAASLAASMHANRDYWVSSPPPLTNVTVNPTGPGTSSVAIDVSSLAAAQTCASTCTAAQMAAYDVQSWGQALAQVVPAANAAIACNLATPPLSCTIQISWQENVTGTSNAEASAASTSGTLNWPQYTLYVEP